jgi:hypothetical protein
MLHIPGKCSFNHHEISSLSLLKFKLYGYYSHKRFFSVFFMVYISFCLSLSVFLYPYVLSLSLVSSMYAVFSFLSNSLCLLAVIFDPFEFNVMLIYLGLHLLVFCLSYLLYVLSLLSSLLLSH